MDADAFDTWLRAMKQFGRARSDAECGRLLGLSKTSILTMKKNGCDRRTALACSALLIGLEPFSGEPHEEPSHPH